MKYKSYFRMVAALSLALAITVSLWLVSPAILCYAQGGYGGGGGGGGAGGSQKYPGLTFLGDRISNEGILSEDVTAISFAGVAQLAMKQGTKVLNKWGDPLYGIVMVEMQEPPPPPTGFIFIGKVYDFGPEGATFDPPATLTFTYNPSLLPEGFDEKNLTIATWDKATGEWVVLDSTVDPVNHTISTQIAHFTPFTILAGTAPAAFTVSDLTISPSKVGIGAEVTISVLVSNTGDFSDSYKVILKIDDALVATKEVTLPGLSSQKVTFTTTRDVAGTHAVDVNGLAGTFEVVETQPAPAPPAPTPPPTTPTIPAPPPSPPLINWYLIGIVAAACTIIGVVVWLVVSRRRAQ